MSEPLFIPLPGNEEMTARLVALCGGETGVLELSAFPDGESHLRFANDLKDRNIVLVCTLAHPNDKFLPLAFAADAARDLGARKVGLVAPYLCYMRQDRRFQPGEAVTSRSFATLLSRSCDWLATVDPHLHRYKALDEIYSIAARTLHAGRALSAWILAHVEKPFLIGPDEESRQWVATVAKDCGADFTVLSKQRLGDRDVRISAMNLLVPQGKTPVFLDDIVSSGVTMREAVRLVAPNSRPVAVAVHGVLNITTADQIARSGARLVTTNTVQNPAAAIDISGLIADGIADLI
jgi:ribose-phosphate pyrophosphokinase